MPLLNGTIPSLVNGVSQQPITVRLPTQAEIQENCYSTLSDGLCKRPPTLHVTQMSNNADTDSFVHFIDRDDEERYVVMIHSGFVSVYDMETGESIPVVDADENEFLSHDYLVCDIPVRHLKALTLADTTIIANNQIKTAMDPVSLIDYPFRLHVWIKQGQSETDYTIRLDGANYTYTTLTTVASYRTNKIAEELAALLVPGLGAGWLVRQSGNVLAIEKTDGTEFSFRLTDGGGDSLMDYVTNKAQDFASLPSRAINGTVVRIIGDNSTRKDDYFLEFQIDGEPAPGTGIESGRWEEVAQVNQDFEFDETTMPHLLVRLQDDAGTITGSPGSIYFQFKPAEWDVREAGTEHTNPEPSFIGKRINDLFLFRNRLGFIADTNVVMSKAGDFFNFWRTTMLSLNDDDPVDVEVSHPRVNKLRHAVPFNEELLLFSDQTQFTLTAEDTLTSKTVKVNATTTFECDKFCKPIAVENLVYFAFDNGDYAGMREYYVQDTQSTKDAQMITGHVPRYIFGRVNRLAASTTEDVMVALSRGERGSLFIYKWYWNGAEKVQSSWSRWTFGENASILGVEFIGPVLYMVVARDGMTFLEKIRMNLAKDDNFVNYVTHLDRRITENDTSVTYYPDENVTAYFLPFPAPENVAVVTRGTENHPETAGVVLEVVTEGLPEFITAHVQADQFVCVRGDQTTGPNGMEEVWIGGRYTMEYRFSPAMLRSQSPMGGISAVTAGRLQIRTWSVTYKDTGYFEAQVTPRHRDTAVNIFNGRVLGSSNNLIGSPSIESGTFRFMIASKNDQVDIDIISDSHLPCRLVSAEWEGFYHTRAGRI